MVQSFPFWSVNGLVGPISENACWSLIGQLVQFFEKPDCCNFCELWWKSWTLISINKTVGQWIRLSHWQVINKETSLLLNQHFEKSTLETNILWIWHFFKSTFETNILWTLMKNLNFDEKLELRWKTLTLVKNLNFDEKLELWWKTWTLIKILIYDENWTLKLLWTLMKILKLIFCEYDIF